MGMLHFVCNANTRPVVYHTEHLQWACVQDISGIFRFPCGNIVKNCSVNFAPFARCPVTEPDLSKFRDFSATYYQATYYCIPDNVDPEVLSVLA